MDLGELPSTGSARDELASTELSIEAGRVGPELAEGSRAATAFSRTAVFLNSVGDKQDEPLARAFPCISLTDFSLPDILLSTYRQSPADRRGSQPTTTHGEERAGLHGKENDCGPQADADKKLDCLPLRSARHLRRHADLGSSRLSHRKLVR